MTLFAGRRCRNLMVPVFAAVWLAACAPIDMLNALIPGEGYHVVKDVPYGDGPRHKLDIYLPDSPGPKPAPVIVFFYGGSWTSGERGEYKFVGEALASRGFIAVVPDYRHHPEGLFPGFVEDGGAAVAWTSAHVAEYGGDAGKIVVMGHSAGAHIAALLALVPHFVADKGGPEDAIKGFVGLAGPYSFDPLAFRGSREVFARLDDIDSARPVTFVRTDAPPMLLMHGDDDGTVGPYNSHDMAAALAKAGARYELRTYADTGHVGLILALAKPFQGNGLILDRVASFVRGLFAPPTE
ncbi:MAG: alpha/beta hydrolase [Rhodobacteraceae bacterium]|nr:alpha/beta hydrolase [Paracoccaceae bacterium]